MDIRKICVIGAGIMGSGIALTCSRAGYTFSIKDIKTEMLMRAFSRMSAVMKTLIEMTLLTEREANSSLERIEGTLSTTKAVKDADLIIEAVPEKIDLKKQVFKELDETCQPHTVFASNTSTFLISEIAKSTKRPDKVIGTHWMNPPYLLPLVEVVRGAKTSAKTVNIVRHFLTSLKKKPILCKDTPGFIVNRMQSALLVEALSLVEQGIATIEDIDTAWTQHLSLRYCHMGPFEAMDSFGLDTELSQYSYLYEKLEETKFRPSDLLKRKVKNRELGLKTGKGFYDHTGKNIDNIIKEKDRQFIELLRLLKIEH